MIRMPTFGIEACVCATYEYIKLKCTEMETKGLMIYTSGF